MSKIFISYSHKQADWVWRRLQPILRASGADVLIDAERFTAGKAVVGQMDATQDLADKHVLCISNEYLGSKFCRHEMDRAIAKDSDFKDGIVIPIVLDKSVKLPRSIKKPDPVFIDLQNDHQSQPWQLLLKSCEFNLGADPISWFDAVDDVADKLRRMQSVNLVVENGTRWQPFLDHLIQAKHPATLLPELKIVDLESPACASRRGFLMALLKQLQIRETLPEGIEALVEFDRQLEGITTARLALVHFDIVGTAERQKEYGVNLFAALRNLTMTERKLGLLIVSRRPFATFLPADHPFSEIPFSVVELKAGT